MPPSQRGLTDTRVTELGKRLAPARAKAGVVRAARWYGMATSPARDLPDVLLVGAKRCGSTSLFAGLVRHPEVAPLFPSAAHRKGVHYFDRSPDRSLAWYRSHFVTRPARRGRISVDASTYYLLHPLAAERAARTVPHAKVVVLVREPAARAFSHYRDEVSGGHETLSFAGAIAAEESRLAPELARMRADPGYYSFIHEHLSYVAWGNYDEHLSRWLSFYPRSQLLVLRSEDFFSDPGSTYARVLGFLGLAAADVPLERENASPGRDSDVAAQETMACLRETYRPHVERLETLVGPLGDWSARSPGPSGR